MNTYKEKPIEIKFDLEDVELSNTSMITYIIELIIKWEESNMINGVLDLDLDKHLK